MLLFIDNYDSFTYNIVQYLGQLGQEVAVYRNDDIDCDKIAQLKPQYLVVGPGPCTPFEAGWACGIKICRLKAYNFTPKPYSPNTV